MRLYQRLFSVLVVVFFCGCGNAVILVEEHKPRAVIVVPEGTPPAVEPIESTDTDPALKSGPRTEAQIKQGLSNENQWYTATVNSVGVAAMELQNYIEKATGSRLAIRTEDGLTKDEVSMGKLFVGPCKETVAFIDVSQIQPEGFVIKTKGNCIYIVGGDKTKAGMQVDGTLNGAYEFLKKYVGVRWLMPGELGEVVPKSESLKVGEIDVKVEPLLWQRRIRDCHAHAEYGEVANILKSWDIPMSRWEKFFDAQTTNAWFRHHRLGARVELKYTHSNMGYWDKYHEKYPEIFAMQPNGSRVNSNVREILCISNPRVWELVAQEKIEELKTNPLRTAASITPNDDGDNNFCCCEKCAALDPPGSPKIYGDDGSLRTPQISLSDRYFRYFNEVAKLVAKEMPDRYLGTYAYIPYKETPVTFNKLEKNLLVGFVGFDTYLNDKAREKDRMLWLNWSRLANQLFIRPNLFWYGMGMPINYTHKFAADIRFMADHSMQAADFDGLIGNWGGEGLNYYVAAELLWNPYADVNEIIDDYCSAAYGKGASEMKAYYDRLEELTNTIAREGKHAAYRAQDAHNLVVYYTDEVLNELESHVKKSLAAIGTSDSAAVKRVQLISTMLDYTRQLKRLIMAAYAVRTGQSTEEEFVKVKDEVNKYFASMTTDWAVAMAHNELYIRNTLSLEPIKK